MASKAGIVLAASFTGTPQKATVSFGTPYPDTNYAVTADAVTANSMIYELAIESKTASGFTINLGSNDKSDLVEADWQTLTIGS